MSVLLCAEDYLQRASASGKAKKTNRQRPLIITPAVAATRSGPRTKPITLTISATGVATKTHSPPRTAKPEPHPGWISINRRTTNGDTSDNNNPARPTPADWSPEDLASGVWFNNGGGSVCIQVRLCTPDEARADLLRPEPSVYSDKTLACAGKRVKYLDQSGNGHIRATPQ